MPRHFLGAIFVVPLIACGQQGENESFDATKSVSCIADDQIGKTLGQL